MAINSQRQMTAIWSCVFTLWNLEWVGGGGKFGAFIPYSTKHNGVKSGMNVQNSNIWFSHISSTGVTWSKIWYKHGQFRHCLKYYTEIQIQLWELRLSPVDNFRQFPLGLRNWSHFCNAERLFTVFSWFMPHQAWLVA